MCAFYKICKIKKYSTNIYTIFTKAVYITRKCFSTLTRQRTNNVTSFTYITCTHVCIFIKSAK